MIRLSYMVIAMCTLITKVMNGADYDKAQEIVFTPAMRLPNIRIPILGF
jgi:hypothetical protein